MGTIYNLEYDYSTENGQSIVFSKKDNKKLTADNLNAVQLKMIQSNRIPHMLPMSLEHIDLVTKLHYDINSKQKLISYFRDNKASMNDYYQLFLSLINTLEEASSYMLDQKNYILQMEFLFIGQNASDVYLTYLPVIDLDKNTSVIEDMKKLLTDVAGEIEGLQGNEFKSILNYIKNASFSLSGLKTLLLELISLRSNVNQMYSNHDYLNGNQMEGSFTENQNAAEQTRSEPIVAGSQSMTKKKGKKKLPPLTSRTKVYLIMGSLLAIALIWKLYDMYRNPAVLLTSSILTVTVIVAVFVFWKIWRPGVAAVETEVPQAIDQPIHNQSNPEPKVRQKQQRFNVQIPKQQYQTQFSPSNVAPVAAAQADTRLLAPDNEDTVLLEEESNLSVATMEKEVDISATLIRTSADEAPQTIAIHTNNFLIGRNEEAVNYPDTAVGVSRIHAEIIKIDSSSFGIKDLGSKNGSKLNGDPMVPYKVYALKEDDEFELGKAHYTFKWSSSQ
ncbi:DUF6382 domain-containing protein [Oceanobacillus profundus]|uniref:FHA domain-containing protein n=1 Tax=Oceanobacillus profundus TaxID=372463 RepID=A0A417YJE4_9BACI|nr:DUF6382 domain-containing protein [Oceanobacillus profundus]RHW33100.1 FHA domain-containing protein [Oceanobacillus profundus]